MVSTPILCWFLLLGLGNAARSTESLIFFCLLGAVDAVLFFTHPR